VRPPRQRLPRYNAEQYFALADIGVISPDDKAELLDGIVVAMSPQSPRHAACVYRTTQALRDALPRETVVRAQMPFHASKNSVPEPDIAVVPGEAADYEKMHPRQALLIVEVADSSLAQDRLTKAAIYARADVPEYWIINLRDDAVEWFKGPNRWNPSYEQRGRALPGELLEVQAFAGVAIEVAGLFPLR
jgi:Uma2 family endonuclease